MTLSITHIWRALFMRFSLAYWTNYLWGYYDLGIRNGKKKKNNIFTQTRFEPKIFYPEKCVNRESMKELA